MARLDCYLAVACLLVKAFCCESHQVVADLVAPFGEWQECERSVPGTCGRAVVDDFVSPEEVSALHNIAASGMHTASEKAGPLIMDINTGYVFGAGGLRNMYTVAKDQRVAFTDGQYALYRQVVTRVQSAISRHFSTKALLTAPTFLTRIIGSDSWQPESEHDKYYHYHGTSVCLL